MTLEQKIFSAFLSEFNHSLLLVHKIWNALMSYIDSTVPLVKFKHSLKLYLLNNTLVISYSIVNS